MLAVGVFSHSQALAANEPNRLIVQQDTTIKTGTTEFVIPVQLENENTITGFQFDLYLPNGFSVATDTYGDYLIELSRTTARRHNLDMRQLENGCLRILCSSMTNATFTGNSGNVLSLTLSVANNVAEGNYEVSIKNIVLTDPQATRYTSADISGTVIVAAPITIKANNLTMVYGDELPQLTFTTEGAELVGTPSLSCAATSTSPVGTYPITISKGTVQNKCDTYVNGTLTITKAPLTVTAEDCTREEKQDNPVFVISYSGWKNGEDESVLIAKPIATTTATKESPMGEYPITVAGGEAQNYDFIYVDGVLTVTKTTGLTAIEADNNPIDIYTVSGRKLKVKSLKLLPDGIYFVKGKKIVVKNN